MDCSLPGSSVHGTFQARTLEWGATTFSVPDTTGEAEPYFGDVLEVLVESLYFGSEVVKDFLERVLGIVAGEAVEPFVGCGEGVEDESAEESVFGVGDEGFDLFRGAREDY